MTTHTKKIHKKKGKIIKKKKKRKKEKKAEQMSSLRPYTTTHTKENNTIMPLVTLFGAKAKKEEAEGERKTEEFHTGG